MRNAFWDFREFCVYTQTLPDSLHMADVGVFSNLLFAILGYCRERIHGHLEASDADARWNRAMNRLEDRLRECTFINNEKVPPYVCKVGQKITLSEDESSPLFKASEFRQLMLAMPIAIANLFELDLEAACRISGTEIFDPTFVCCALLILFAEWYGAARKIPQDVDTVRDQVHTPITSSQCIACNCTISFCNSAND